MELDSLDLTRPDHRTALVQIWNAACGQDLAITERLVQYNARPLPGGAQGVQLATHEGRPAGFVWASAIPRWEGIPPEQGWIDAIAVLPEAQKSKTGSALLEWAEGWLRQQGCSQVRLGGSLTGYARPGNLPQIEAEARPGQPGQEDAVIDFLKREGNHRWAFECLDFLQAGGRIQDYMLLWTARGVDGCCQMTFEDSARPMDRFYPRLLPRPWGQTGSVAASRDLGDKGHTQFLVHAALAHLRERGVRGCVIDWTNLVEFYNNLGFEPYRRYTVLLKSL